tara:strand:+ start:233 stop:526 length:294 start_codon:yes stop_codon:yes gene_type:complete
MISTLIPTLGKALLGKGLEMAFGQGSSSRGAPQITPPSFAGAYRQTGRTSDAGVADIGDFGDMDLSSTSHDVTLAMWNKRLFGGDESYTKITLPTIT